MLITGLKNLNSNIKHYIDELTKHKTVAEIMNALFNDYITNIVDKAYHRLLTSDNVSKFRPEIIERLEAHGHSSRYITKTSEELAAIREIPVGQAEELVYQTLHEIVEAFRNMEKHTIPEGGGKPCKVSAGRDGRCQRTDERNPFIHWRADGTEPAGFEWDL